MGRSYWERRIPDAVGGLGVVLFVALLLVQVAFNVSTPGDLLDSEVVVGVATTAPFALALVYGGRLLRRGDLAPERRLRIAGWCGGGLGLFLGLNVPMIVVFPPSGPGNVVGWALFAASVGASVGLAIGVVEARAIERARAAERAAVRVDRAEAKRESLDYLNGLLRHEVLNNANVIEGYVSLLADAHADDRVTTDRLDVIRTQTRRMIDVIEDVRVLIEATEADPAFETVRLAEVLTVEVADLRESYPRAEIDVSVPDGTRVVADPLLHRVFSNLLANAIQHNDGDRPTVRVDAERDGDSVVVRVSDDGPGVPDEVRNALFERERGGRHGLGLFLVRTLVERYGGTVELAETGPDGSTFAVELPAASDAGVAGERGRPVTAGRSTGPGE